MQKRRERIEQWRAERNKVKEIIPINIAPPSKKWSLEDDDDDDDDVGGNKNDGDDDELDPLDAYMQVKFGGFFFFFFFFSVFFFFFFFSYVTVLEYLLLLFPCVVKLFIERIQWNAKLSILILVKVSRILLFSNNIFQMHLL